MIKIKNIMNKYKNNNNTIYNSRIYIVFAYLHICIFTYLHIYINPVFVFNKKITQHSSFIIHITIIVKNVYRNI